MGHEVNGPGEPVALSSRFEEALLYATAVHAGQLRKSTAIPYISHLLIVAGTALEYGANEDEAIAALLHDAVEDGGGKARADEICRRFGDRVADIVRGCSDTDDIPKPPAAERKRRYLARLGAETDPSVLLVSACDKLANARSLLKDYRAIGDELFKRFTVGKQETLKYYAQIAEILRAHQAILPNQKAAVVPDLAEVVCQLIEEAGTTASV